MDKDKAIDYCKFISQTNRTLFENRKNHEWRIFLAILTFFSLTMLYKITQQAEVRINFWICLIAYLILISLSIMFFIFMHRANNKNKSFSHNAEHAIQQMINGKKIKLDLFVDNYIKQKDERDKQNKKGENKIFQLMKPGRGGYWDVLIKSCVIIVFACASLVILFSAENNNFNGTLWVQTASEYKANSLQAYNAAMQNIQKAIHDPSWTAAVEQTNDCSSLPLAAIFDIDETVLDTSRYQAQLVIEGNDFNTDSWDRWLAKKEAPAIPGAITFINAMHDLGVEVFYISNRECRKREGCESGCPQEQDTMDNLIKVGVIDVKPEHILLKNEQPEWTSEKKTRREVVASKYRIIMMFGDDLGDFLPDVKKNITHVQRTALVHKYEDNWGKKWYILSNPMYGSWLQILEEPKSKYLEGY